MLISKRNLIYNKASQKGHWKITDFIKYVAVKH